MVGDQISLDEYREIKAAYDLSDDSDDAMMVEQCNEQRGAVINGETWTARQFAYHFVRCEAEEAQGDANEARATMEW